MIRWLWRILFRENQDDYNARKWGTDEKPKYPGEADVE